MDNPITKNSTMSVALVLALCGGAYLAGAQYTALSTGLAAVKEDNSDIKALTRKISDLASDNKRRLDIMEDRVK